VAKAYRELEHEGAIELRQGTGAFGASRRSASARTLKMLVGLTRFRDD